VYIQKSERGYSYHTFLKGCTMKKPIKQTVKPPKKKGKIKGILLLLVAAVFFGYMVYAGADITGFLALIIGLVSSFMGIIYLWSPGKTTKKKGSKRLK
jgi:hypothetical protein